ncbi:HRDC-like protein [Neurospora hispaniola]|uniref:HRDC-like protein n=1 Tax=Neurospora hispaniola TaxID=588809 RepID=A0AAJ0I329_9PEZI|nr:HRDC-like protein [Neurospora hispaniola]
MTLFRFVQSDTVNAVPHRDHGRQTKTPNLEPPSDNSVQHTFPRITEYSAFVLEQLSQYHHQHSSATTAPQTRQESPRRSHCRPNEPAIWIKFPPGSECINPNTVFLLQNASEQVNEGTNERTNPQPKIMSDQHHAPTSRSKPPPPGEEEASAVLKLGEFQDVDTLTLSEASLVINALMTKRRKDRKDRNETDVLNKTLDYLDAFARFKQKENVEAVERLLSARKELTKFERAQIGSLCCDSADECKTLIPSLADKITDDELQELLDEMAKLMST